MSNQRRAVRTRSASEHDEEHVEDKDVAQAEHTDTDALLAEIDALLAEVEADEEAERRRAFKEKLHSLGFIGRARARCEELVRMPRFMGDMLGAEPYDGPPCIGC